LDDGDIFIDSDENDVDDNEPTGNDEDVVDDTGMEILLLFGAMTSWVVDAVVVDVSAVVSIGCSGAVVDTGSTDDVVAVAVAVTLTVVVDVVTPSNE
jgi:hypothetical protein